MSDKKEINLEKVLFGRPTKYNAKIHVQAAYDAMCEGHTDEGLAKILSVHPATIYNWQNKHPDFLEAIHVGKRVCDSEIESALYKSAKGYECEEVEESGKVDANGKWLHKTIKKTKKKHPPNILAAKFWLSNRKAGAWQDRQKVDTSLIIQGEMVIFELPNNGRGKDEIENK